MVKTVTNKMATTSSTKSQLAGSLFLQTGTNTSFAAHQVDLLKAIQECGSISKAAKAVGISYKTAWDRIDAMNNLSATPLVLRASGGAKGGGTQLTELGQRIVSGFQSLIDEHQRFIAQLGQQLQSLDDIAHFVRNEHMNTSARNQFRGTITNITEGAVNAEISLDIGIQQPLIAIITQDSAKQLNLIEGSECIAIISDSAVLLSKDIAIATSARNKLTGKVSRLVTGAVNTDISLDIGANKTINAIITNTSAKELGFQEGDHACALFKAPSVILMKVT